MIKARVLMTLEGTKAAQGYTPSKLRKILQPSTLTLVRGKGPQREVNSPSAIRPLKGGVKVGAKLAWRPYPKVRETI